MKGRSGLGRSTGNLLRDPIPPSQCPRPSSRLPPDHRRNRPRLSLDEKNFLALPSLPPSSPHPFFLSNASKKKASLRELSRAPRSIRSRCRFPSPCPVIPTYLLLLLLLPYDKARKYGRQASENKHGRIVKLLNRGVAGFTARSAIAFRQVAAL